jgi:hypothetical protein
MDNDVFNSFTLKTYEHFRLGRQPQQSSWHFVPQPERIRNLFVWNRRNRNMVKKHQ